MIKQEELEKIQDKYKNLENELNQSVNDKDKYVSLSKEYADLKPLYDQVNLYLAHQSELDELNSRSLNFVIEIMNRTKLISLRNELLLEILPLKV